MSNSDRFKHEYHKYADEQVRNRAHDEGIGRLRMAFFVAVLGPASVIVMHTIKFDPPNLLRIIIQGTAPLAILLLIVNYVRLPAKAKGSTTAILVVIFTILAAAATFPAAKLFSLTPTGPLS